MVEPELGGADRHLARSGFARAGVRNRRRRWPPLDGSRPRRGNPLAWVADLAPSAGPRDAARTALSRSANSRRSPLSSGLKRVGNATCSRLVSRIEVDLHRLRLPRDEFTSPSACAVHSRWM